MSDNAASTAKPEVPEAPADVRPEPAARPKEFGDWERKGRCIDF